MENITVKDHSVSGEQFQLVFDEVLEMYNTEPQPSLEHLASYYESEDYISHTDAKRNLFEKIYHWVRSYMLSKKMSLVATNTKSNGKKVLDIGCGTGDFLAIAQKYKWEIAGVEPDAQARTIAAQKTGIEIHSNDWLSQIPQTLKVMMQRTTKNFGQPMMFHDTYGISLKNRSNHFLERKT